MSNQQNKAIGRRFFEEFDRRNFDGIRSLLAPGAMAHLPGAPAPLDWAAHQQYASAFVAAFPNLHTVVEDQVADANHVVTRTTLRGTQTKEFMGIPATNKEVTIAGMSWFHIVNGLIAEEWTEFDRLGMMVQLGVASGPPPIPPPREATPDRREQLAPLSDPRAIVRRWFERVDHGGVPDVDEYVVQGYKDHNPPPIPGLSPGVTGVRQIFSFGLTAFSDFYHTVDASIADGDKVASRITGYGTHTGDFLGIPGTGKKVSMSGITVHRVSGGRLAEHWAQIDAMSLLQQMGAIPAQT